MRDGILWCPHCHNPHKLSDKYCTATGKSLDQRVHQPSNHTHMVPPHTLVGTVIDNKYEIVRRIGSGGMGEVFEANNRLLKRPVAIKVVVRSSAEAVERLRREARVIAAIQHPNICDVYDVGDMPDGNPYLVLERLNGQTLQDHLRKHKRLSPARAIEIFAQILSGLQHAHAAGIVHRDLKPANVFLVERVGLPPLIKLLDFGFAKDLSQPDRKMTRPGATCGTPEYMSPEQLCAHEVDSRSDLFSIGIMLFEVLSNRHPFGGGTVAEICMQIARQPFTDLRQLQPDLPLELTNLVHQALDKVPSLRPQSALAMQVALVNIDAPESEPTSSGTDSCLPRVRSDSSPLSH